MVIVHNVKICVLFGHLVVLSWFRAISSLTLVLVMCLDCRCEVTIICVATFICFGLWWRLFIASTITIWMLYIRCSTLERLNCVWIPILLNNWCQVAVQYQEYISVVVQDVVNKTLTQFRNVFFIVCNFKSFMQTRSSTFSNIKIFVIGELKIHVLKWNVEFLFILLKEHIHTRQVIHSLFPYDFLFVSANFFEVFYQLFFVFQVYT